MESGLPLTSTTTVGTPVSYNSLDEVFLHAAQVQAGHVVAFAVSGRIFLSSTSFWPWFSPTTTMATSAFLAARIASANPLLSVPSTPQPFTWLTLVWGEALFWMPSRMVTTCCGMALGE